MQRRGTDLYLSYLLRLWQASTDGQPVWRASLTSPHTGERWSFASLAKLCAFLDATTRSVPPGNTPSSEADDEGVESELP